MKLVGIDIGGTKVNVCLGNEQGEVFATRRLESPELGSQEEGLSKIADAVESLLAENGTALQDVEAIGVGAPGPVDLRQGILKTPPNLPGWVNVPVKAYLGERLHRPVFLHNDANAQALAEFRFGSCRDVNDLVFLTVSTGMGGGIISNGRLVQGVSDIGGEVGHFIIEPNGSRCQCGQRGCFEAYCGGLNVALRLQHQIAKHNIHTTILDHAGGVLEDVDFRAFRAAVKDNDAFALEHWNTFIERLAQGLGIILMTLNPAAIILGTIAIHSGDLLMQPLRDALPRYAWKPAIDACRIEPSTLHDRISELSALAAALYGLETGT